jgi:hypothetical protein
MFAFLLHFSYDWLYEYQFSGVLEISPVTTSLITYQRQIQQTLKQNIQTETRRIKYLSI